ncbi:type II toxin-antitoxin system Phd/YefM family antitoxin [Fundidesulfovibrio soli]|uniref:type II toxin-antitoxin system Phd/YefM family antitoxin n=1 Tax=Fundidesulfovibrio soli TaxID=2922716 RepID=UPI001FAF522C|nr:type II toxin-antitoxin system Phd/YefM family antitoxin [Fundidesulfovibrio soli]
MKLSEAVKPISYFKAHAADIVREISEGGQPVVITQNGEAKAMLVNIQEYERLQESLAMLKLLSQSSRSIEQGQVHPMEQVFDELLQDSQG